MSLRNTRGGSTIGEFIVQFEHVCQAMQTAIRSLLYEQGLQNKSVANILLAGHTAEPLRALFESLIGEIVNPNDNEKEIIKNILSRIQEITAKRNDVVHSTWFIGWGNEATQDFSEVPGHKLHKNKKSSVLKSFKYKVEDFSAFAVEADKLSSLVRRLNGCIIGEFSIEENFKINDVGNVIDKNE